MSGNVLFKHGGRSILITGVVVLLVVLGLRYGAIENGLLPRDCPATAAADLSCSLKWALVQTFHQQRLGWFSLACGSVAFMLSCRRLAWAGWLSGVAGLVLYSYDYAAVGGVLSLLVLLRPRQRGQREHQPG